MKQRIRVAAIIQRGEDVLLLRRALGRADDVVRWELPTGKILFGEQPEEAMVRVVHDFVGVRVQTVQLSDVITFTNLRDVSEINNLYVVYRVEFDGDAKVVVNDRYSIYKWVKNTEIGVMTLDDASLSVLEIENNRGRGENRGTFRGVANAATIYVDGGSRGNPGPAGVGYYILDVDGAVLKRGGEYIGFSTSRVAEYYAMKEGAEQALELGLKSVKFVSDNLMVVNQINGVYMVKNRDLMLIYSDVMKLLGQLESYEVVHVQREQNREADAEVNKVINEHIKNGPLGAH